MSKEIFLAILAELINAGYGDEIEWQRSLKPCADPDTFYREACWVILNSGMKEQIARKIWGRIQAHWSNGGIKAGDVFGHKGKATAIDNLRMNSRTLFNRYLQAHDKIEYLKTLAWIGPITCYHLAKNLGQDLVKPDRHLVRIAHQYSTTPDALCQQISNDTGEKKCVVDIILWRAANLGWI